MNLRQLLKDRKLEILRKVWHALNGLTVVAIYQFDFLSKNNMSRILIGILFLSVLSEYVRLSNRDINLKIKKYFNLIMRKREYEGVSGIPFYLAGCCFSITFFSKTIAVISILNLALGDPFASFCGRKWGHLSFKFKNGKSYIGFVSSMILCSLVSYIYLKFFSPPQKYGILFAAGSCGFTGAISELISFIDDNLFVPVFSSIVLYIFFNA